MDADANVTFDPCPGVPLDEFRAHVTHDVTNKRNTPRFAVITNVYLSVLHLIVQAPRNHVTTIRIFTQMTQRQNCDARPGTDWAIFLIISIGRHVKFGTRASKL